MNRRIKIGSMAITAIAIVAAIAFSTSGIGVVNVGSSLNSNNKVVIQVDRVNGEHLTYVVQPNTMTIYGESVTENGLAFGTLSGGWTTTNHLNENGLKYISLSDTTQTADNTPTVLAGEITTNGLSRAAGTVTAPVSPTWNVFTVSYKFTATGTQACKVAGLNNNVTPNSSDSLWAYATFTEVTLNSGDNITITWTVTFTAGG